MVHAALLLGSLWTVGAHAPPLPVESATEPSPPVPNAEAPRPRIVTPPMPRRPTLPGRDPTQVAEAPHELPDSPYRPRLEGDEAQADARVWRSATGEPQVSYSLHTFVIRDRGTADGISLLVGLDSHGRRPRRPPPPDLPRPRIQLGQIVSTAIFDPALARRLLRSRTNRVRSCFVPGQQRNPTLAGQLVIEVIVGPDGVVLEAAAITTTLPDPAVTACVVEMAETMRFPATGSRASIRFSLSLASIPPGDADTRSTAGPRPM